MSREMHCKDQDGAQAELCICPYCGTLFTPKRKWAAFCSTRCRNGYAVDFGATGTIASVRRIKSGASIVVHLHGPAAERALKHELRDVVQLVRQPARRKA